MLDHSWQKSSYCGQGESCLHVAASAPAKTIHLTESGDPRGAILGASPDAFGALLGAIKGGRSRHGA
ncbi:DUF397 domain-containing protein [Streptomyces sp. BH-SS-21]|uniref:DUF397 domain-containing protein n=1 Tax=Streptomyces liliiviolaceus TaxID=2823109 RepID=A0A941B6S8_9ACTN|nr:DUF397 domain-containing protein [Streptomyces liliiviolaceus]MBQ0847258.1 DUF397 domain-containing protein [Streptomyces liliiviolaceus]